jgi:hypothetical protein
MSSLQDRPLHDTGLRRFAQLVYNVVAAKKRVSYTDVSDDIIKELRRTGTTVISTAAVAPGGGGGGKGAAAGERAEAGGGRGGRGGGGGGGGGARAPKGGADADACEDKDGVIDDRTVRRRVYDSLNVLAALGHIEKDGKCVAFRAQPQCALDELAASAAAVDRQAAATTRRRSELREVIFQQLALRRLVHDNRVRADAAAADGAGGAGEGDAGAAGAGAGAGAGAAAVGTAGAGAGAATGAAAAGAAAGAASPPPPHAPPPGSVRLPFLLLAAPAPTRIRLLTPAREAAPSSVTVELDAPYDLCEHGDALRMLRLCEFPPADVRRYVPASLHRLVLRGTVRGSARARPERAKRASEASAPAAATRHAGATRNAGAAELCAASRIAWRHDVCLAPRARTRRRRGEMPGSARV